MTEQKKSTGLTRIPPKQLEAASRSIHALTELFGADRYNLIVPLTHMAIPRGMKLAITEVRVSSAVDSRGNGEDVASIGSTGKFLVLRHKLDQIANGAGIAWVDERRKDGGRHPHYCEYFVKGEITDYDGTTRTVTGGKTIDLREDVDGVPGKDFSDMGGKPGNPGKRVTEARKFISELASTKASNRAIAKCIGIKRGYTKEQLEKPFVVMKLVLDPDAADARELIMANAVGATNALYGAKAAAHVVDVEAEFVEPEQSGAVGEWPNDPPADVTDPETGEVVSAAESIKRDYNRFRTGGGSDDDFKKLFIAATGLKASTGATAEHALSVTQAVTAYLANQGGLPL